eukprot:gene10727-3347_t
MREIVSLQVGQAGIQVGNSVWELYCKEHNITNEGIKLKTTGKDNDFSTFFNETKSGKHVPRALFADLEPSVVDTVRTGEYGKLFHPNQLISGKEDAANNFARGHYTTGKEEIEKILDSTRKLVESCSSLQGFMMFNSVGGGTGSGLGSLILEKLTEEYGKKSKIGFQIFPSPQISTSLVESYNAVLASHSLLENTDISVVFDNEALYDISKNKLGIQQPTYKNLNRIISQVISSLTTSLRFDGELNVDISEFQTNLVPYPRIHFMLSSLAPMISMKNFSHENYSVSDITNDVIESKSMMAKCDPRDGKYIAACLMYRGNVQAQEVNQAVNFIKKKKKMDFVDWSPCGFKWGVNKNPPAIVKESEFIEVDKSVCMISNSSSIGNVFNRIDKNFDLMYAKRAFVHWFVEEGMEEGEFSEARDDLENLENSYQEISGKTVQKEELEFE